MSIFSKLKIILTEIGRTCLLRMRFTLRRHSERRRNIKATNSSVGKVDSNNKSGDNRGSGNDQIVKKKVSILQKIGDNMNPTVRLVDIGAVKLYQKKVNGEVNSKPKKGTRKYSPLTTTKNTNTKKVKGTTKKDPVTTSQVLKDNSLINMQPVVRLVDCYESLFSLSAIIASASSSSASKPPPPPAFRKSPAKHQKTATRRGRPSRKAPKVKQLYPILQDLKSRGLQDFKLSDLIKKSAEKIGPVINVKAIAHLLVNACTLGNAPNRHNRPFDLEDPWEECLAITEALQIYAAHVTPKESLCLFEPTISTSSDSDPGVGKKTWQYLSTLGNSHFFFKMLRTPGAIAVFESKMVGIMKAGVKVDAFNWTLTEVGSILGFWLAKLYNDRGISDNDLPLELNLAKQHFMELNGWEYDKAVVHDFPMN